MSKTFYIIVPYTTAAATQGKVSGIFSFGRSKTPQSFTPEVFEEYKKQLWQRVDHIIQGIIRTGVRAVPLNTEEIIELYYGLYNPGEPGQGKPTIEQ